MSSVRQITSVTGKMGLALVGGEPLHQGEVQGGGRYRASICQPIHYSACLLASSRMTKLVVGSTEHAAVPREIIRGSSAGVTWHHVIVPWSERWTRRGHLIGGYMGSQVC